MMHLTICIHVVEVIIQYFDKRSDLLMKYRKKPVVIEAIQYTGDNIHAVMAFVKKLSDKDNNECTIYNVITGNEYSIMTLEGNMKISKNDYVIKGVQGEFYPCKSDIFKKTYEIVV